LAVPGADAGIDNHTIETVKRTTLQNLPWRQAIVLPLLVVLLATGIVERCMGRLLLGPDGRFGFWEGNIWSNECSQRLLDPYSVSHVCHGILFFGLLWLVARRWSVRFRFLLALLVEAGWEILENSPVIINRYRQTTIALGYNGDSILNSLSDIAMMASGFILAAQLRPRASLALFVLLEVGCLFWVRDNLTLNIIMLICPIQAIKAWQMHGRLIVGALAPL
jgi:hypothetical protein